MIDRNEINTLLSESKREVEGIEKDGFDYTPDYLLAKGWLHCLLYLKEEYFGND